MTSRNPDPRNIPGLAPALLAARQIRGYSRRQLAELCGVPERLITDFERGKRVPTRAQLDAIWNALADDVPATDPASPEAAPTSTRARSER